MDLETFALSPKTGLLSKVRRKTSLNVFLTVEEITLVHWAGNVSIFLSFAHLIRMRVRIRVSTGILSYGLVRQ